MTKTELKDIVRECMIENYINTCLENTIIVESTGNKKRCS